MVLITTVYRTLNSRCQQVLQNVTFTEAAEITGLGEDEILWAIEEGRCDTEAYIVVDAADAAEVMSTLN
jgi:hypothetical protein